MASDEIIAANTKALQDLISTLTKQKGATPGEMPLSDVEGKTVEQLRDEIVKQTSLENIMRRKAELEKVSQARRQAIKVLQEQTNDLQGEEKKLMEEQIKLLQEQEKAYARQNSAMMKVLDTSKQVLEVTKIIKNTASAMLGALEKSFRTFEEIDISVFYLENIKKGAYQIDQLNNQLQRTTGITRDVRKDIQSLVGDTEGLAISGQDAVKTFGTLQSRFNDFSRLSPQMQRELVKTSVRLERVGISAQTSAQLFQISSKVLGNSGKDATELADDLRILAEQIGVVPQEMAQGFATASPRLAAHGQNMKKVFQDLALQAKATGVEVNTLLGIAQGFDTFESAARKTAQLNAMFGTQLNSVQLLNAEEGERIEMIKQQLALTGRTVDMLGRFEIKSLAQILGTDDQNVRMLLRDTTDVMGELDEAIQKQGISLKDRAKALTDEDAKRRVAVERDLLYAGEKYLDVIEEVVAKQSQNARYIREQKEALEDVVGYYKTIRDAAALGRFGMDPQTVGIASGVGSAIGTAVGVGTAAAGIYGIAKTPAGQKILSNLFQSAAQSGPGGPTLPPTTPPTAPTAPGIQPNLVAQQLAQQKAATPGQAANIIDDIAKATQKSADDVLKAGAAPGQAANIADDIAKATQKSADDVLKAGTAAKSVLKPLTKNILRFANAFFAYREAEERREKGESGASAYFKETTSAIASTLAALKVGALITAGAAATTLSAPVVAGLALAGGGLAATGVDVGVEAILDSLIPSSPSPATSGDPNAMLNKAKQNQSSLPPDKTVSLVINGPINAVLPEDVQDRLGQKTTARISRENPLGTLGQGTQVIT